MTKEKNIEQTSDILLDRDLYRTIKKMDRLTMQGLIQDIYESGRKKGTEECGSESSSAAEIDFDALKKSAYNIPYNARNEWLTISTIK